MDSYRHDLKSDTETLCGIKCGPERDDTDEAGNDILISCECGRPECEYPVTCPVCRTLKTGRVN